MVEPDCLGIIGQSDCNAAPPPEEDYNYENYPSSLPNGVWSLTLSGVKDCEFSMDGFWPGTLKCPNMASSVICLSAPLTGTTHCTAPDMVGGTSVQNFTGVAICDF